MREPLYGVRDVQTYDLEKRVWSDADFAVMGWHDATIWSTLADPERFEFLIDLDYVFRWVEPAPGQTHYKFWVAPVTMVFSNAHSVKIGIDSAQGSIEVADLHIDDSRPSPNGRFTEKTYRFECQEGVLSVVATGFEMFVRQSPVLLSAQRLSLAQRNGVSFERA